MHRIIDNNGTIHTGSEEEMIEAFAVMMYPDKNHSAEKLAAWYTEWEGDLILCKDIMSSK